MIRSRRRISFTTESHSHAFVTGPNGEDMTDLNSLVNLPEGAILINGAAINNRSQVLAYATYAPEPASSRGTKRGEYDF